MTETEEPTPEDEDQQWCSELLLNSEQNEPNEELMNRYYKKQARFRNYHRHHRHTEFFTLNCLVFDLEQREFRLYDIKSADLYIKLDLIELNELVNTRLGNRLFVAFF